MFLSVGHSPCMCCLCVGFCSCLLLHSISCRKYTRKRMPVSVLVIFVMYLGLSWFSESVLFIRKFVLPFCAPVSIIMFLMSLPYTRPRSTLCRSRLDRVPPFPLRMEQRCHIAIVPTRPFWFSGNFSQTTVKLGLKLGKYLVKIY